MECSHSIIRSLVFGLSFPFLFDTAMGEDNVSSSSPELWISASKLPQKTYDGPMFMNQAADELNSEASKTANGPIGSVPLLDSIFPDEQRYGSDWIQLISGEWLRGSIKNMQDNQLDFDSDKLGEKTFDLADIIYIRSSRYFEVLRSDRTVASGTIEMDRHSVYITSGESKTMFPRSELDAFNHGGTREIDHWSGSLAFGLQSRSGNTSSLDWNAGLTIKRRSANTRFEIDYTSNYSESEHDETANNQTGSLLLDTFVSHRSFIRFPGCEYLRDPFQNIANRVTVGAGYGYYLIKQPHWEWNVATGPAYQWTEFDSVQAGEKSSEGSAAFFIQTSMVVDLTSDLTWSLNYTGQLTKSDVGGNIHHLDSTIAVDITRQLTLNVTANWDRTSKPQPDSNGEIPKPDDFRLTVSLGIQF